MKNKRIASIVLGVFLLAGCAAEESAAPVTTQQPGGGQKINVEKTQQGASLEISGTEEMVTGKQTITPRTQEEAKSSETLTLPGEEGFSGTVNTSTEQYTLADKTAYNDAIRLRDSSKCSQVTDTNLQKQCNTDVSDLKILDEALNKQDKSICQKLSTAERKKDCEAQITATASSGGQTDAEAKLEADIIKSGDYTRCKELSSDGAKFECEVNILAEKAKSTSDKSWCQKGSNADIQKACELSLKSEE